MTQRLFSWDDDMNFDKIYQISLNGQTSPYFMKMNTYLQQYKVNQDNLSKAAVLLIYYFFNDREDEFNELKERMQEYDSDGYNQIKKELELLRNTNYRSNVTLGGKSRRTHRKKRSRGGLFKMGAVGNPMQELVMGTNRKGNTTYNYKTVTNETLTKRAANNAAFKKAQANLNMKSKANQMERNKKMAEQAIIDDKVDQLIIRADTKGSKAFNEVFKILDKLRTYPNRYYEKAEEKYEIYEDELYAEDTDPYIFNQAIIECMFYAYLAWITASGVNKLSDTSKLQFKDKLIMLMVKARMVNMKFSKTNNSSKTIYALLQNKNPNDLLYEKEDFGSFIQRIEQTLSTNGGKRRTRRR